MSLPGKVAQTDGYPAWQPKHGSELQRIVKDTYRKLFGKDPVVRGIHAGLECGLFSEKYPNLDMVSFGLRSATCTRPTSVSSYQPCRWFGTTCSKS